MNEFDWAQTGGIVGIVLLIIWSGLKRKWLFFYVHDAIVADRDKQLAAKTAEAEEWKRMALVQAGIIESTVSSVERVVTRTLSSEEAKARRGDDPRERPGSTYRVPGPGSAP